METGDKIKIFPDTDVKAYVAMIMNMGFYCKVKKGEYILIKGRSRLNEEEKRAVGRSITATRRKAGLSRRQMAEMMGVKNPCTIFNWEVGRRIPCEVNQRKLKKLYGWGGIKK